MRLTERCIYREYREYCESGVKKTVAKALIGQRFPMYLIGQRYRDGGGVDGVGIMHQQVWEGVREGGMGYI